MVGSSFTAPVIGRVIRMLAYQWTFVLDSRPRTFSFFTNLMQVRRIIIIQSLRPRLSRFLSSLDDVTASGLVPA